MQYFDETGQSASSYGKNTFQFPISSKYCMIKQKDTSIRYNALQAVEIVVLVHIFFWPDGVKERALNRTSDL